MRTILFILALFLSIAGFGQRRGPSKNKYDINYSASELQHRLKEPKVSLYEGLIDGQEVDFSVAVAKDNNSITITIFPRPGTFIPEQIQPQNFQVRYKNDRVNTTSGRVQRMASNQYWLDLASLPKGTYVLTLDNIQTGLPITFTNY